MNKGKLALFFALLVVSVGFSFAGTSEKLPLPKELQDVKLPWFAIDAKDGEETYNGVINNDKLKEITRQRNSKRVVFAFFATWCLPCREGLKLLSEKNEELKKRRVLVVLINIGESDYVKTGKWIEEYAKEDWLLGFDKFSNLPENFGLAGYGAEVSLPATLVLDPDLRPLMLIGREGDDYPQILWGNL
jgi:thiol-disulfide isomerase/thioredoxin